MTETCPAAPEGLWRMGIRGHTISCEMMWTSDGQSFLANRCITCGQSERVEPKTDG